MSLAIGIVGLPNVGKSTLFKALTKKQIDIANYPFCTIEPNVGIVEVPDERLQKLAVAAKAQKIVPTVVEFVDIAGLVKGASQGEGLGNKFLSNIREVDAIAHVVRAFDDADVSHVSGQVNPSADVETINIELAIADLETVSRQHREAQKKTKSGLGKDLELTLKTLAKAQTALENETALHLLTWDEEEKKILQPLNLLTTKPVLYVVNVNEDKAGQKFSLPGTPDEQIVTISAKIEAELADLNDEDKKTYLTELGLTASGLDRLIVAGYKLLNLLTFFTAGVQEARAWTVTAGSTAPQAAGKIHTDFEAGFIKAEICNWADFVNYGELGCKEKGLMRTEGKNYIMADGDTCHFHFH